MVGSVQLGRAEFVLLEGGPGTVRYRVEAPVVPYFGQVPRPGAAWVLQDGRCSSGETPEQVRDRCASLYGGPGLLVRFEGTEDRWPYLPPPRDGEREVSRTPM